MQGSYPVDREVSPHAGHAASGHLGSWSDTGSASSLPACADLLGENTDPDPLFFVETWTFGVDTAARNFHARRHTPDRHHLNQPHPGAPAFQSFHFFTPVPFVEESISASGSTTIPAAFSSAWKNAYGTPASSPLSDAPHDGTPFTPFDPSQTLTAELACRTLGIAPSSSRKQIKAAYRQLVWRYHPDRLPHSSDHDRRLATDRMTSINAAYHMLCGPAPTSI